MSPTIEEIREHLLCLRNIAGKRSLSEGASGMDEGAHVFRREGEGWVVEFRGRVSRIRDSVGLHYLASLVGNPKREMSAVDLFLAVRGAARAPAPGRARRNVGRAIWTALGRIASADPSLGEHFARSVRIGTVCSYQPDPKSSPAPTTRRPAPPPSES